MSDRNAVIAEVLPDYRTTLQSIARSYCPNPYADADDLVQEAYIAMWRALETPREADNLAAYLTTVARHRIHDVARTGRTQFGTAAAPPPRLKARGEETRRRITDFIRDWRRDHGDDPTDTVIGHGLGLDRSTVSEQRKRMREVGAQATTGKIDVTWPTSLDALVEDADGWEGPLLAGPDLLDGVLWAYHHGEIVEAINALLPHHRVYVVDRFWRGMTEAESNAVRDTDVRWRRLRPVLAQKLAHLVDA